METPSKPRKQSGADAVRKDFNPSGDPDVARIKELAAELFDAVNDLECKHSHDVGSFERWRALARTNIELASMWAVKAATYE